MASYTPSATGLIAYFDTEVSTTKQYYQLSHRTVSYVTTVARYDTLEHAKSAVDEYLAQSGSNTQTRNAVARRIGANGWAEAYFISVIYGSWEADG